MNFRDKQIIVLGLAKSGTAVAKILQKLGAKVIVNDAKPEEQCKGKNELESLGIKVICGSHPDDLISYETDLVIKNPGIPYHIPPIQTALSLQIPVITEVEVAYQLSKAPFIGITGSNGKTTTTTLIGEIIEQAGLNPIVAGNIGTVVSEQAFLANENQVLVTELSSFQLKGTQSFRPKIGVIINIYPAHLDYHKSMEDYILSKAKLFQNQTPEDYAVLNVDCEECVKLIPSIKSQIFQFSKKYEVERGTYVSKGIIYWKDQERTESILPVSELSLKGEHNVENVLAAITATRLYGVDVEIIREVLRDFKGVEHRLEFVRTTPNQVTYYNDSKATNPTATITALKSFPQKVILIAGGLDRGIDFHELIEPFEQHVKELITFGQTAEKLSKVAKLAGLDRIYTVDNVDSAVELAARTAISGDVVLLSPACASWDMFSSFEERGRMFKEAVHKI
ncbi:UDP-N-acetylmuramoyl-L-alanine--D-glutamate ligase [Tepidibacillus fermentans]|uniref:UDP-N-acetylmuramoylalanine--D-glutamate ligase n=1 Tax=Tepidibacillus fermentans TaxID=1281767 RepID=A0A4R3KKK6_9BACI|nr:UDP-N-acetylmuramoyl-L-alanine--D-glutamate ligase [Tepidibacillus fermentans]TCS84415.1 UDP-N-acetylmuramoylalanine--D-glutamate ligase [Tepidibacillus fermentans]